MNKYRFRCSRLKCNQYSALQELLLLKMAASLRSFPCLLLSLMLSKINNLIFFKTMQVRLNSCDIFESIPVFIFFDSFLIESAYEFKMKNASSVSSNYILVIWKSLSHKIDNSRMHHYFQVVILLFLHFYFFIWIVIVNDKLNSHWVLHTSDLVPTKAKFIKKKQKNKYHCNLQ